MWTVKAGKEAERSVGKHIFFLDIFLPAGSFELLQYRTILQPLKENFRLFVIKPESVSKPGCHNTVGGQTHGKQNRLFRHFSFAHNIHGYEGRET